MIYVLLEGDRGERRQRGSGSRTYVATCWCVGGSVVEIICKRIQRHTIVPILRHVLRLRFWGDEVECSRVYYEPVVQVGLILQVWKGFRYGGPVGCELCFLVGE